MNGVSMMQRNMNRNNTMNRKRKPVQNVNFKQARKQTSNLLLSSSAMTTRYKNKIQKKYAVGGKNQIQIEQNAKKKTMNKLLAGKTLIPHLGANWGSDSKGASAANMNISFVLEPKSLNVGKKNSKKRKFESMSVCDEEIKLK